MSTFGVSALSGPLRGRSDGKSKLERLHQEAKEILEQKAKEIHDYNEVVSQAEEELAVLQEELRHKTQLASQYESANTVDRQDDNTELLEQLIEATTTPGALILDPFAGSGSTLVAAAKTGRQYIGIEIDEHYSQLAATRAAEHQKGATA